MLGATGSPNSQSLKGPSPRFSRTERGYQFSESATRFAGEARVEKVMRASSKTMLAFGGWQAVAPFEVLSGDSVHASWFIPVLFLSVGLAVFALGTRGFRRSIGVDLSMAELRFCRLNAFNRPRVTHRLPMDRVEKLTTQPCRGPIAWTSLYLHLKGRTNPTCVLAGRPVEIESLRNRIEEDLVQSAMAGGTDKPGGASPVTLQA